MAKNITKMEAVGWYACICSIKYYIVHSPTYHSEKFHQHTNILPTLVQSEMGMDQIVKDKFSLIWR